MARQQAAEAGLIDLEKYNKRFQEIVDEIERELDDKGYIKGQNVRSEDGAIHKITDRKIQLFRKIENTDKMQYNLQVFPIVVTWQSKRKKWEKSQHAIYSKVLFSAKTET